MAKTGQRKYRCEECKATQFEHWTARVRAARIRCTACGSARMELTSDAAKQDCKRLQDIRASGGTPSAPASQ